MIDFLHQLSDVKFCALLLWAFLTFWLLLGIAEDWFERLLEWFVNRKS